MMWKQFGIQTSQTFSLIREQWFQVVLWTLFWVLPIMLLTVYFTTFLQVRSVEIGSGIFSNFLAIYIPFVVGFWLQVPFIRIVSLNEHEEKMGVIDLLLESIRFFPPLFLAGSLLFIGVFSGIIFFLLPGIWLFVTYSLFVQTAVLERQSSMMSLWRAGILVKGSRGSLLLIILLIAFLELSIQIGNTLFVYGIFSISEIGLVNQLLVHACIIPLQAVLFTYYYEGLVKQQDKIIEKSI